MYSRSAATAQPLHSRRRMIFALIAQRATETNVALASRSWPGAESLILTPKEALERLQPGDVALGRLDVRPTLDGMDDGVSELAQLAARGVRVLNGPRTLLAAHDKLLTARQFHAGRDPAPGDHALLGHRRDSTARAAGGDQAALRELGRRRLPLRRRPGAAPLPRAAAREALVPHAGRDRPGPDSAARLGPAADRGRRPRDRCRQPRRRPRRVAHQRRARRGSRARARPARRGLRARDRGCRGRRREPGRRRPAAHARRRLRRARAERRLRLHFRVLPRGRRLRLRDPGARRAARSACLRSCRTRSTTRRARSCSTRPRLRPPPSLRAGTRAGAEARRAGRGARRARGRADRAADLRLDLPRHGRPPARATRHHAAVPGRERRQPLAAEAPARRTAGSSSSGAAARARVPADVARLLVGVLRGADLEEAATLQTSRTGKRATLGGGTVEATLDEVSLLDGQRAEDGLHGARGRAARRRSESR